MNINITETINYFNGGTVRVCLYISEPQID